MKMNVVRPQVTLGRWLNPSSPHHQQQRQISRNWAPHQQVQQRLRLAARALVKDEKPEICTADELHYVDIPNSDWSLALWRYLPSPQAKVSRNHPLLLLSGVGTNAIAFDLSPQSSFARYMSGEGFDTWILEVRGAGLSIRGRESKGRSENSGQASTMRSQKKLWGPWVSDYGRKAQSSMLLSYPYLNAGVGPMMDNFQRELDLFLNSNWDFDQCFKEDLPLVIEYIRSQTNPRDGRLFAIGHSMGGILLYAMLSLCGFEGHDSHFAAVSTIASSLDYSSSKSSLKLLLPLADPAEALNIPAIPLGALLAAMHPLASRPPFLLSRLNSQISAQDMMLPELLEKLVLKNFCTVPAKLLLQLATAFQSTGLSDRSRTFFYKDHLHSSNVPVLALAGDQDLVCPPEAVYATIKMIPEHTVTYKVFGKPDGPHYAHYDLVGGRHAAKQVYPCIIKFLSAHDTIDSSSNGA